MHISHSILINMMLSCLFKDRPCCRCAFLWDQASPRRHHCQRIWLAHTWRTSVSLSFLPKHSEKALTPSPFLISLMERACLQSSYLKFQSNGTTEGCSLIGKVKTARCGKTLCKACITGEEAHITALCSQHTCKVFVSTTCNLREVLFQSPGKATYTNLHPFNSSNSSSTVVGSIHCGPLLGRQRLLFFLLSINSTNSYFTKILPSTPP